MKKIKLFALAIMAMIGVDAFAAVTPGKYTYTKDGLTYECTVATGGVAAGAVLIGRSDDAAYATTTAFEIPATITPSGATGAWNNVTPALSFEVVGINDNAFTNNSVITSITFATGSKVATIGKNAFKGSAITGIALPATVTTIDNNAFENSAIATFSWAPTADATIGDAAFKGCSALAVAFEVPAKVTTIGEAAFQNSAITALTIAANPKLAEIDAIFIKGTAVSEIDLTPAAATLVTLENGAFFSSSLKKLVFAANFNATTGAPAVSCNLADFTNKPFEGATALEEIVLPATVVALPDDVFKGTQLKSLDLSYTNVATVGKIFGATKLYDYSTLTEVKLPQGNAAFAISTGAFAFCTSLNNVVFPAKWDGSAAKAASKSFEGCDALKAVVYQPADADFSDTPATYGPFAVDAFEGCSGVVITTTYKVYTAMTNGTVKPDNATWSAAAPASAKAYISVASNWTAVKKDYAYSVSKDNGTVYSVYVDVAAGEDAAIYMLPYKVVGGYYNVAANTEVVIKAKKTVESGDNAGKLEVEKLSKPTSQIIATELTKLAADALVQDLADLVSDPQRPYIYIAAISGGAFQFGPVSGNSVKAGNFYVTSTRPTTNGAARIIWLDEDSDLTAIKSVKKANAENGAIYNLAGQKVSASYKGVVIKNGKKYIQK